VKFLAVLCKLFYGERNILTSVISNPTIATQNDSEPWGLYYLNK